MLARAFAAVRPFDAASFAAACATTVLLASDQGGFFAHTWPWAGIALGAAAALVLISPVPIRLDPPALAVVAGVAAGTVGIAAYSVADRLASGVHAADQQAALLERPLGYANALGVLCALGLAIVAVLGASDRRPGVLAALAAPAAVLATALALTGSRGAWLALAAGLLVAAAARAGGRGRAAAGAATGAAILTALYVATAFAAPD